MGFLATRDVRLHYEDKGSGLPLLLFHAFPLSAAMFAPQVEALSKRVRFLLPDSRGLGQSSLGEGPATMERLAEDGLALLDHLNIGSAVVGGVSMGGYASLALLRRDPGRVRGLVLADTQVGADDEAARAGRETLAQDVLQRGPEVLVERLLPRLLGASAKDRLRADVAAMLRASSPEGVAAALRGMALRVDSRDMLSRFGGSVLVLVGAEDVLTPPEKARAMASLASSATLLEIPRAGHLSNLEAPEAFNQALEKFLEPLRAAQGV
jgi:pimeloyl-ACP methyl ester carboxylesterase